ncbi:carbohydrate-binding protein [Actinomyces urogenitalis]|nr:carbohydrate-binding protein [Actinomyces urogenitalis]
MSIIDQAPAPEPAPSAPAWQAGVHYEAGDLVTYDGQVYRVVQEHTSQADWRPDGVPALYTPAH